jgi:hypothetical protein
MPHGKTPGIPASWLELVVLLGLLTLIVWLAFVRPVGIAPDGHDGSARLLAHASILERQLHDLHTKASHYLDNAPREYEAYFRDTTITHQHLRTDLQALDRGIQTLINAEIDKDDPSLVQNHDNSRPDALSIAQLQQEWNDFSRGLEEQLGVDPEMPRLEWGARHIVEALDPVIATVAATREQLQSSTALSTAPGVTAPAWAWPVVRGLVDPFPGMVRSARTPGLGTRD